MESSAAVRGLSPIIEQVTIFVTAYSLRVRVWFGRGSGVLCCGGVWWQGQKKGQSLGPARGGGCLVGLIEGEDGV